MASACAYVRVSSRAQNHAMQLAAVERAAAARGDTLERIYSESRSGRTLARPELDRVRADARAGKIGRLYLFRLDRLTRSGIRDTFEVVEELRRHGCNIVTVSEGFDLEGPAAEVVLAVMAWASKMERLAINERISAARDRMEAEGKPWGRPPRMTAEQVAHAKELRAAGKTLREIGAALGVSKDTIALALSQKPPEIEGSDPPQETPPPPASRRTSG